jgi:hypothetical protein
MATEKIFVGIDDQVIELKGADKEAFIAMRAKEQAKDEAKKAEIQAQIELRKSAYTKLGLTEQEINAIL